MALLCSWQLSQNKRQGHSDRLSPAQIQAACEFIRGFAPGAQDALLQYIAKDGPYASVLFESTVGCSVWWEAGLRLGFDPSLTDCALRLSAIVDSTAGLERHFSRLRLTYGMLRSRLAVEKAGKLAFLYPQLRGV